MEVLHWLARGKDGELIDRRDAADNAAARGRPQEKRSVVVSGVCDETLWRDTVLCNGKLAVLDLR